MTYHTVFINGQAFHCNTSMSLQDILTYLDFDISLVTVEYNQEILDYSDFKNLFLNSQDIIEVITIVGGG